MSLVSKDADLKLWSGDVLQPGLRLGNEEFLKSVMLYNLEKEPYFSRRFILPVAKVCIDLYNINQTEYYEEKKKNKIPIMLY